MTRELTGRHVLIGFVVAFGIIISVNIALAVNAVRTFPGLEVKNSYVASQEFDESRAAQEALGWEVSAKVVGGELILTIDDANGPVQPAIEKAIFGRATSVRDDQVPEFAHNGTAFAAPVMSDGGNWNLRIEARAEDGTLFRQRIVVNVEQ